MKLNKYFLTVFLLCIISTVFASGDGSSKNLYLGVNANFHQNSIYNTTYYENVLWRASSGSHLTYFLDVYYMFGKNFGIGTGVKNGIYSTTLSLDRLNRQLEHTETDIDGDLYYPQFSFSEFSDMMTIETYEFPLYIKFEADGFFIDLGAIVSKINTADYMLNGDVTVSGFYPEYNVLLSDLPEYDFGTTNLNNEHHQFNTPSIVISGYASMGFMIPIRKDLLLKISGNGVYGLTDIKYNEKKHLNDFYRVTQQKGAFTRLVSLGGGLGVYFRF